MVRKILLKKAIFIVSLFSLQCMSHSEDSNLINFSDTESKPISEAPEINYSFQDLTEKLEVLKGDKSKRKIEYLEAEIASRHYASTFLEIFKSIKNTSWNFVVPEEIPDREHFGDLALEYQETRFKHLLIFKNNKPIIERENPLSLGIQKVVIYPCYGLQRDKKLLEQPKFIRHTNPKILRASPILRKVDSVPRCLRLGFLDSTGQLNIYEFTNFFCFKENLVFELRNRYNHMSKIFLKTKISESSIDDIKRILKEKKGFKQKRKFIKYLIPELGVDLLTLSIMPPLYFYNIHKAKKRKDSLDNKNGQRTSMLDTILKEL